MALPLLNTKLFLPPARPDMVQRPRLIERLDGILRPGVRLGLVSAPAGFGKTSLLSGWIARRERPAAWLALDTGDNAPGVFLAYLVAAVERARPGLLRETAALHRTAASGAEPLPAVSLLAALVNELSALDPSDPLVIALDDFQFIQAVEVNEAVHFLVEHLPPGVRLAIATRVDPSLPLARLRARGQMVELRAGDLRFTPQEASAFLFDVMRVQPQAADRHTLAEALTSRTEGWAAGLQMAALALQTALQSAPATGAAEFVRSFTGSHRYILDYLAEEVLTNLPASTSAFLLQTSVLERFCADLCQAVVGEEREEGKPVFGNSVLADAGFVDSPPPAPSTESPNNETTTTPPPFSALLAHLERSNLFLVPLDGERRWYRYHHLFADLLRARLKQAAPGRIPELHRRASAWFEANGLLSEAIQHALAAGEAGGGNADYERAADLVEKHTFRLLMRGELHALQRWVSLLPDHLTEQRSWFNIHRAWVLVFIGQVEPVEALLRRAESGAQARPLAERALLLGHCHAVRTQRAIITNQFQEVFEQGRLAAEKLPEGAWPRGVAEWAVGFVHRTQGDLEAAGEIFERLVRADQTASDPWGLAMTATDLGIVRRSQGRLREAQAVYRSALAQLERLGARSLGYVGRLLTAYAGVLYELNELQPARQLLEEAVELNQRWRNPNHLVFANLTLARTACAGGQFEEAAHLLDAAEAGLRGQPVVATLAAAVQAGRAGLLLAQGQSAPLIAALEDEIHRELQEAGASRPYSEMRELRQCLFARVLIASRRCEDALRLLDELAPAARRAGRKTALAEMLTLTALARRALGQPGDALVVLDEAAAIMEPEGGVRAIADAAPLLPGALADLLEQLKRRPGSAGPAYLDRLLDALPAHAHRPEPQAAPAAPAGAALSPTGSVLVEPLSEREKEVLRLLSEGLTNTQIAGRLIIAPGTVKAHTASIFRKLDAANRTQAVAIARSIGLIP